MRSATVCLRITIVTSITPLEEGNAPAKETIGVLDGDLAFCGVRASPLCLLEFHSKIVFPFPIGLKGFGNADTT
jgi:hypothetical protein